MTQTIDHTALKRVASELRKTAAESAEVVGSQNYLTIRVAADIQERLGVPASKSLVCADYLVTGIIDDLHTAAASRGCRISDESLASVLREGAPRFSAMAVSMCEQAKASGERKKKEAALGVIRK